METPNVIAPGNVIAGLQAQRDEIRSLLAPISGIDSPEADTAAAKQIKAAKVVLSGMEEKRKLATAQLDQVKAVLMGPGKEAKAAIDTAVAARNAYATQVLALQRAKQVLGEKVRGWVLQFTDGLQKAESIEQWQMLTSLKPSGKRLAAMAAELCEPLCESSQKAFRAYADAAWATYWGGIIEAQAAAKGTGYIDLTASPSPAIAAPHTAEAPVIEAVRAEAVGLVQDVREGLASGTAIYYEAQAHGMATDWAAAVRLYANHGGNLDRLQFVLDWLAKNGRPEVTGVTYTEKARTRS